MEAHFSTGVGVLYYITDIFTMLQATAILKQKPMRKKKSTVLVDVSNTVIGSINQSN